MPLVLVNKAVSLVSNLSLKLIMISPRTMSGMFYISISDEDKFHYKPFQNKKKCNSYSLGTSNRILDCGKLNWQPLQCTIYILQYTRTYRKINEAG